MRLRAGYARSSCGSDCPPLTIRSPTLTQDMYRSWSLVHRLSFGNQSKACRIPDPAGRATVENETARLKIAPSLLRDDDNDTDDGKRSATRLHGDVRRRRHTSLAFLPASAALLVIGERHPALTSSHWLNITYDHLIGSQRKPPTTTATIPTTQATRARHTPFYRRLHFPTPLLLPTPLTHCALSLSFGALAAPPLSRLLSKCRLARHDRTSSTSSSSSSSHSPVSAHGVGRRRGV